MGGGYARAEGEVVQINTKMNLFSFFEKREKACKDGLFEELIFCYNTEKLLHEDENDIMPEVKRPEELITDELIDLLLWVRKHSRENVSVDELIGHRERLIQFFNQKIRL